MELGDLSSARAHLQEASRLRIAKGDMELIESTQAALDRVDRSATVLIGPDGYTECELVSGDCLVFDGAFTPHGRTPLGAGESVLLVSFGFRALGAPS